MARKPFSVKLVLDARRKKSDKEHPVYIRILYDSRKAEIFLYVYVDPAKWDDGRIKGKTTYDTYLNNKLQDCIRKVNLIRLELESKDKLIDVKSIRDAYTGTNQAKEPNMLEYFIAYIKNLEDRKEHTNGVVQHYHTTLNYLMDFLGSVNMKDILLRDFTIKELQSFETYLLSKKNPFLHKPIQKSTAIKYLKKLNTVLNYAFNREDILRNPFRQFKISHPKTNRVALTLEELEKIRIHPLADNHSLMRCRDIFVFSVYTGLRFSDAMALTAANIHKDKTGQHWLSVYQIKTKEEVRIPLIKEAMDIIEMYKPVRLPGGSLLPKISNQKFNSYLHTIGSLVGIEKNITHHTARHSFATLSLASGIDIKTVSSLLGHRSIKTTEIYAKITVSQKTANMLQDAF
jgi:integrase/recombinase XerD